MARGQCRWPCAATFDQPPVDCQSKEPKGLSVHHCLTPFSREIGSHSHLSLDKGRGRPSRARPSGTKPRKATQDGNTPADNDTEGVDYRNPFLTRFFDRAQNGGFFAGSALA